MVGIGSAAPEPSIIETEVCDRYFCEFVIPCSFNCSDRQNSWSSTKRARSPSSFEREGLMEILPMSMISNEIQSPENTADWLNARGWVSRHHHIRCAVATYIDTMDAKLRPVNRLP